MNANVSRHVVADLLPLYAAGEAHPDSARLVEDWMAKDPELARDLERLRGVDARVAGTAAAAPTETELLALRRIRVALNLRSLLLGLALFFSLLPFSFLVRKDEFHWLVLDNPVLTGVIVAVAVVLWLGWFLVAARLRVRSGV